MASVMVGRARCPECSFEAAHVKRSEKTLYRYCPQCGSQYFARTPDQEAALMAKTRTADAPAPASTTAPAPAATPAPAASPPTASETPTPPPPPAPRKRVGLFG